MSERIARAELACQSHPPLALGGDAERGLVQLAIPGGGIITLTPAQARAMSTALAVTATSVDYLHAEQDLGEPSPEAGQAIRPASDT